MKMKAVPFAGFAFAAMLATSATAFAAAPSAGYHVNQTVAPVGSILHPIADRDYDDHDRGRDWRDDDHRGRGWRDHDRGERWGGGHYRRCRFWRHECADRWGWGGFRFRRCLIRHDCF